ncbi:hypothetical protein DXT76_01690 [Halobacillus trueperi]|uniref:Uncharacterized protein n=2 Tax=Halobacillus TaxID=45667 RepID=A0A1H0Q325_HALAD|nr:MULTISPECIES: hypothetical protein [Halobacillus]RDY72532.1 hypothetical protein DXT76_01690 [Halobacillus trueperi]SDP11078.1 hypothetical protein SAMN05421677_11220 [Halobacillus aidingensis]
MKKSIVFIFTLILSYGLVSWGTGLVLTSLHDADPWIVNGGEDPSFFVKAMPALTVVLPIIMAIFLTDKFGQRRGIKE